MLLLELGCKGLGAALQFDEGFVAFAVGGDLAEVVCDGGLENLLGKGRLVWGVGVGVGVVGGVVAARRRGVVD